MDLSQLPTTNSKGKKRLGRGYGSGRGGHTSTRGHKGQKARGSIGLFFQGTKFKKSLIKRLPLFRGKGKLKSQTDVIVVDAKALSVFKDNELVNFDSLQKNGILSKKLRKNTLVKILGSAEVKVPLNIALPVSKTVRENIQKAGGKIIEPACEKETSEEKNG
ncbi:50S ribosomal protein L15 [Patescibacteria group bacterium]|nr:50S ribosomal protein L15 [Patescibacteria group bacterium]